ncbi:MAG TPA: LacI family DNA-binding transcriptional regulator [Bryobacteraceae bacterium]|jgi:LacI family transcriptional regulator|nr:LacI family DNA-binding transcriptional regulator [Bryobacteraceae bacterium]
MKDIADDLGVSLMTVSKALRSHSDISEETRQRVLRRARELNYQPNWIARSLVTRRTYTVGVVIPDLMHSFFAEVANGLARELEPSGYQIVVTNSDENAETERRQIELLLGRSVDGLIIASALEHWKKGMPVVLKSSTAPYVLIDRMPSSPGFNYVGTCDEEVGRLAAGHLIEQGCTRIAHIRGPERPNSLRRLHGFRQTMEKHGKKTPADYVAIGGRDDEGGYRAMRQLLQLERPPDGVSCYNDPVAAGAIKAVLEAGLQVPADVAIIGAGNVHYSDLLRVPLSTVDQGSSTIGAAAAKMLLACIESKQPPEPKSVQLPPKLIVRDSSRRSLR